jgi:hypothetical protein
VIEHLGHEAAELLSLTNAGEARSLTNLTEMASWEVPACSGANAAVWDDREVISLGSTPGPCRGSDHRVTSRAGQGAGGRAARGAA